MRVEMLARVAGAGLVVIAPAAAVRAQTPADLQSLLACRNLVEDAARLACFDREAAQVAATGDDLVAVDVEQIETIERDGFGLKMPALPRLSMSIFAARPAAPTPETTADPPVGHPPAPIVAERPGEQAKADARIASRSDDGQIREIDLAIARVRVRGYNIVVIEMENDQVWESLEGRNARRLGRRVQPGDRAVIRRAALGSYLMRINGDGPAYRVTRRR